MTYFYGQLSIEVDAEFSTSRKTINLEFMRTDASNIILRSIKSLRTTVPGSNFFGINGGVFDNTLQLLSIAVNDDKPVDGKAGGTGVGWGNSIRRGTVRWDGATGSTGVSVVNTASEIIVTDRTSYWAQGGLSMNLEIEAIEDWENSIIQEQPEGLRWKENAARSGLVYEISGKLGDRQTTVFLVITRTPCTFWEFRQATKLGFPYAIDGIFLDGGGSTQINCAETSFDGDGRVIPQMIGLKAR